MRLSISILVCVVMMSASNINAAANNSNEPTGVIETLSTNKTKDSKKVMEFMAGRKLEITVNNSNNKLLVNLTGANETLDWVIFQPKGKVISRISTSTKIDEIKIDNLTSGKYVLMIKDAYGRTIFQAFDKA